MKDEGRISRPSHAPFSQGRAPILPNLTPEDCDASHAAKATYAPVPLRTTRHDLQRRCLARPNRTGTSPECQHVPMYFYAISTHFLHRFATRFCLNTCHFPREIMDHQPRRKKFGPQSSMNAAPTCCQPLFPSCRGLKSAAAIVEAERISFVPAHGIIPPTAARAMNGPQGDAVCV
jgi:hypothetical protein